ncbi:MULTISPECIES: AlpA family transcriptional regulator [Pseudomonas]|uniref:AlpA family transcriptional regulator n=1 Tax=Pseudomonas asiatica TaxID=2219225 RepID=A0AAJ5IMN5_9PSED|nr:MULTISPECIES: AlpA family transcriptional regulator [Pseudomonas]MDM9596950.1 AlpA family transcriptional regulator [Pseudomonas shirazica]MDO2416353.1 AlpA family transcriptional regulator [Pseudomonas shirazica]MDS9588918.1 AlpA family transcriptional regulator [Pseudomonas sp. HTZ1]UUC19770.1 AlpA family transcriptional regulator [Pseudomonas asiatica]
MAMQTSPTQLPRRFIKLPKVKDRTGLSTTEIYRRIADGRFPSQITLGPKSVVWDESEIIAWMDDRIAESRAVA